MHQHLIELSVPDWIACHCLHIIHPAKIFRSLASCPRMTFFASELPRHGPPQGFLSQECKDLSSSTPHAGHSLGRPCGSTERGRQKAEGQALFRSVQAGLRGQLRWYLSGNLKTVGMQGVIKGFYGIKKCRSQLEKNLWQHRKRPTGSRRTSSASFRASWTRGQQRWYLSRNLSTVGVQGNCKRSVWCDDMQVIIEEELVAALKEANGKQKEKVCFIQCKLD